MAKPDHADDIGARVAHRYHHPLARSPMLEDDARSFVAMLQFTDDALLHCEPAVDHVELVPTLEGEAVDELLMASTRTRSAARSPPGFHCRRLPFRAL